MKFKTIVSSLIHSFSKHNQEKKDMKPLVATAMENIKNTDLRSKNEALYSRWILTYAEYLADKPMEICSRFITGFLSEYIGCVLKEKDKYPEAYKKVIYPDPITSDFLWAIDTTIKEKKYSRLETWSIASAGNTMDTSLEDMINEVVEKALQLPYDEAINFMGEIAGAWILTYPMEIFNQQSYVEMIFNALDGWPSEEEDYIYILRRDLQMELWEWIK